MTAPSSLPDADVLRQQLMSPEPMKRVLALHALELAVDPVDSTERAALIAAAGKFASRGIPYYALNDPHYCAWVGKAVDFWQRLHHFESASALRG